jgi:hypothetical protein
MEEGEGRLSAREREGGGDMKADGSANGRQARRERFMTVGPFKRVCS